MQVGTLQSRDECRGLTPAVVAYRWSADAILRCVLQGGRDRDNREIQRTYFLGNVVSNKKSNSRITARDIDR